mgnify:CR=1 FL=1
MAINLSDISGFSKFVGTKFVEDISFGEEPLIDVRVMTAEHKAEKAKKAADIEARKAAKKAKAKKHAAERERQIAERNAVSPLTTEEERLKTIDSMDERRKLPTDTKGSIPESDRRY